MEKNKEKNIVHINTFVNIINQNIYARSVVVHKYVNIKDINKPARDVEEKPDVNIMYKYILV